MRRLSIVLLLAACGGQERSNPAPVIVPAQPRASSLPASAPSTSAIAASSSTPVATSPSPTMVKLSTSDPRCGLDAEGRVWTWNAGELERDAESIKGARSISCAGRHACIVASDGATWCWGNRGYGALGDGVDAMQTKQWVTNDPVKVLDIANVVDLGLDFDRTCARTTNGDVFCWGDSEFGKAGDGRLPDNVGREKLRPGKSILSGATTVSVAGAHAVSVTTDGRVSCWGQNNSSSCGQPAKTRYVARPAFVPGLKDVAIASAGGANTCIADKSGKVSCWGGVSEVLGPARPKGDVVATDKPVPIPIVEKVVELAVGDSGFACARLTGGSVHCWGRNDNGQLGDGTRKTSDTPAPVQGLGRASAIAVGLDDACALVEGGRVMCWGHDMMKKDSHSRADDALVPVVLRSAR